MSFTEARGGGVCKVCPLQRFPGQDPVEGVGSVKCAGVCEVCRGL